MTTCLFAATGCANDASPGQAVAKGTTEYLDRIQHPCQVVDASGLDKRTATRRDEDRAPANRLQQQAEGLTLDDARPAAGPGAMRCRRVQPRRLRTQRRDAGRAGCAGRSRESWR